MKSFCQTIKVLTRVMEGRAVIIRKKDESNLMLFTSIDFFFLTSVCLWIMYVVLFTNRVPFSLLLLKTIKCTNFKLLIYLCIFFSDIEK